MIFDKLSNAHLYYGMGKKFEDAFKFLENTDFSSMPAGSYTDRRTRDRFQSQEI